MNNDDKKKEAPSMSAFTTRGGGGNGFRMPVQNTEKNSSEGDAVAVVVAMEQTFDTNYFARQPSVSSSFGNTANNDTSSIITTISNNNNRRFHATKAKEEKVIDLTKSSSAVRLQANDHSGFHHVAASKTKKDTKDLMMMMMQPENNNHNNNNMPANTLPFAQPSATMATATSTTVIKKELDNNGEKIGKPTIEQSTTATVSQQHASVIPRGNGYTKANPIERRKMEHQWRVATFESAEQAAADAVPGEPPSSPKQSSSSSNYHMDDAACQSPTSVKSSGGSLASAASSNVSSLKSSVKSGTSSRKSVILVLNSEHDKVGRGGISSSSSKEKKKYHQFEWMTVQEERRMHSENTGSKVSNPGHHNKESSSNSTKQKARKYKIKDDRQLREDAAELLAKIELASSSSSRAHTHTINGGKKRSKSRSSKPSSRRPVQGTVVEIPTTAAEQQGSPKPVFICIYWILPVCLMLFMAICAAGLSMLLMGYFDKQDNGDWESRIDPVEGIRRMDDIETYLVANRISASSMMGEATKDSPQIQAAQWLAWGDRAKVKIPKVDANSTETYPFITRYVMAVLYFATDGPNWRLQFDFLSQKDACLWKGAIYTETGDTVALGVHCDEDGNIIEINLNGNGLNGGLPDELTHLTTLKVFQVGSNSKIRGELPRGLQRLTSLEHITVSRNQMTGPLPTQLCAMTNLQQIYMGFNQFEGRLPSCMDSLVNLSTLFLSNNMLTGPIPDTMANLNMLQLLWLDDNILSGDITSTFNRLPLLRAIFLEDNSFEGIVDEKFLFRSTNLVQLDVSGNSLQGSLPAHFFVPDRFDKLEVMDWHNNKLSGSLPDILVTNNVIQVLALHENEFTGSFPDSWGARLPSLFHLDVSSNQFQGDLPSSIGSMTGLENLFMGQNMWNKGPVPLSWSELKLLKELSLKQSQRTGLLPDFLPNLNQLVFLDLDNNEFRGEIPTLFGELSNLEFLLLSRNRLIGAVPRELAKLSHLRGTFLEGNYLLGNVDHLCALPQYAEAAEDGEWTLLVADCSDDNTTLPALKCECCTICCSAAPLLFPNDEANMTITSSNTPFAVSENNNTTENGMVVMSPSLFVTRPTCHDWTALANIDPRWESVYARTSYSFGDQAWFDVSSRNSNKNK